MIPQTPQVLPRATLMYPYSPQDRPQEFLIFQKVVVWATNRTSWVTELPQLLKIPDL